MLASGQRKTEARPAAALQTQGGSLGVSRALHKLLEVHYKWDLTGKATEGRPTSPLAETMASQFKNCGEGLPPTPPLPVPRRERCCEPVHTATARHSSLASANCQLRDGSVPSDNVLMTPSFLLPRPSSPRLLLTAQLHLTSETGCPQDARGSPDSAQAAKTGF